MPRIFDSSYLTQRRAEKAIAGGFYTKAGTASNSFVGFQPQLGMRDSSVLNMVKNGQMTTYTRLNTCIEISPGCPCSVLDTSLVTPPYVPAIPGAVSGITFTVGSIVLSWVAPTTGGPFHYIIVPYLNGIALPSVTTNDTTYRFTDLNEWQPYYFSICAENSLGPGPDTMSSTYFLSPPSALSVALSGSSDVIVPEAALTYIVNYGINHLLQYVASVSLGATLAARLLYVYAATLTQAWNWVTSDNRILGIHDHWDWAMKSAVPLMTNDSIIWMTCIVDYITPLLISAPYQSIYNCSTNVTTCVKAMGDYDAWSVAWNVWFALRQADGSIAASSTLPTASANWGNTIVVDGVTVNDIANFPEPQQWTRLTFNGKKQGYLTYNWDHVLSSCLTEQNEIDIAASISPATGASHDAEIDMIQQITASLTDQQKIIAEFWAGGPGTVSPPLIFTWLWKEYVRSSTTISCANLMFSFLDLAIHLFEGSRVTWRIKSQYMQARPIQEIRRRYAGQQIASWNGIIDGSQWTPYQKNNFVTPPFADFPSGHSHFSKAFAITMNKWFGPVITKTSINYDTETAICPLFVVNELSVYGDFIIPSGASNIQTGVTPLHPVLLSFATWDDMANQAGLSRLYGGIHASSANMASQTTAVVTDGYISTVWNISTGILPPAAAASPAMDEWVAPMEPDAPIDYSTDPSVIQGLAQLPLV